MNRKLTADDLAGLGTALVTPFKSGGVDYEAYGVMVANQTMAGVDFLVPLGTTAETPCLSDKEKVRLLEMTVSGASSVLLEGIIKPEGMPVVAGCGTNSLSGTLKNIELLSPCSPDAFLVVVPYYNKPTQAGMYQYFTAVADATDIPIVLYNVPGRTGANLLPETTLRLAEHPNIIAIKEASGNIAQISEIIANAPEGFSVLCGNDDQTLELMGLGAKGVISVVSNVAGFQMVEMIRAIQDGDIEKAKLYNGILSPLYEHCFAESNPIPVKAALSLLGDCTDEMRLPLTPATEDTKKLLAADLERLGYNISKI